MGNELPHAVGQTPSAPITDAELPAATATVPDEQRGGALGFLDFIAGYESRGNYNARFGAVANAEDPTFTSMTIDQVLDWQDGRKFSASGKYQIIRDTLLFLKSVMGLSGSELFDAAQQDAMGIRLLERRGLRDYRDGTMSRDDFALSVAREWAALPGVKSPFGATSVYAGDGVNRALVSVDAYLGAIDRIQPELPCGEVPTRPHDGRGSDSKPSVAGSNS